MTKYLYEYDTGNRFGPASYESVQKYESSVNQGKQFFLYPYHGYQLRMVVKDSLEKNG
jgi:hypothetical protein